MRVGVPVGLVFDCAEPREFGAFWEAVLDYVEKPPPDGYESWDAYDDAHGMPESERDAGYAIVDPEGVGPSIFFQRVPEPKTAKNRLHLDVNVGGDASLSFEERRLRIEAAVAPLEAMGATLLTCSEHHDDYFIVMRDPEGNEFCLV